MASGKRECRSRRQMFCKRPCRASVGEPKSGSNFLGLLSVLCEHPSYSHVPSTSFFLQPAPKKVGCVLAGGWLQRYGTAAGHGGSGSHRMSLTFAISSGLTKLESQRFHASCHCSWSSLSPLLQFMFLLAPFWKTGPWGDCISFP